MTDPAPNLPRAEITLQRRAAAYSSWAQTPNRTARLAPARRAWEARFEQIVDPDGVMTAKARAQAADSARRAFYADMARKSIAARRKRRPTAASD